MAEELSVHENKRAHRCSMLLGEQEPFGCAHVQPDQLDWVAVGQVRQDLVSVGAEVAGGCLHDRYGGFLFHEYCLGFGHVQQPVMSLKKR
ncbi:MAG: hypothetical protein V9E82_02630 [Candidatus Nanopelagicales bacterium]